MARPVLILAYEKRLRYAILLPRRAAVLPRSLAIVRNLREGWYTKLVRALYLPIEINAVVRKPEGSTTQPVAAGIGTAGPSPGS